MNLNLFCITISFFLAQMATAQEMKFPIKDFFSKCDQIRSFLQMANLQCTQPKPAVHDTFI